MSTPESVPSGCAGGGGASGGGGGGDRNVAAIKNGLRLTCDGVPSNLHPVGRVIYARG